MHMLRTVLVATIALAGCGKDDKKEGAGPATPKTTDPGPAAAAPADPAPAAAKKEELPPPPPEAFQGKTRLVNLLVGRDGKGQTVDIWAKRSFSHGPVKLAEGVAPGTASDWFAVPKGQSVTIVAAGAGPDADEVGGMFAPQEGEQTSHTLTLGDSGKPSAGLTGFKAEKPAAGQGLVVLEAGAFQGHAEAFKPTLGAWGYSFKVGDGTACLEGRQKGLNLGGTSYVDYEVPPGKATFTLHKGDDYKCEQPPVYTIELDVAADAATMVHVYTPDAKSIAHLVLPLEL